MRSRRGFTLIELLVVIAIIALLMSILMPALQRVKKQARAVKCMAHLKQWGLIFSMYTDEHDGEFQKGLDRGHHWIVVLRPYFSDRSDTDMFYCPSATRHVEDVGEWGHDTAWYFDSGMGTDHGSYGINGWVETNTRQGEEKHWKNKNVAQAATIPLLLGANRLDGWPEAWDEPPGWDGQFNTGQGDNMRRFCMNRHTGFLNCLFLDFGVRKVGLKGLWSLRWHREWTQDIRQTGLPDWPEWMQRFKD
jgi:prepilin-type N-terminal cleavage/methylation domain-containing protein